MSGDLPQREHAETMQRLLRMMKILAHVAVFSLAYFCLCVCVYMCLIFVCKSVRLRACACVCVCVFVGGLTFLGCIVGTHDPSFDKCLHPYSRGPSPCVTDGMGPKYRAHAMAPPCYWDII